MKKKFGVGGIGLILAMLLGVILAPAAHADPRFIRWNPGDAITVAWKLDNTYNNLGTGPYNTIDQLGTLPLVSVDRTSTFIFDSKTPDCLPDGPSWVEIRSYKYYQPAQKSNTEWLISRGYLNKGDDSSVYISYVWRHIDGCAPIAPAVDPVATVATTTQAVENNSTTFFAWITPNDPTGPIDANTVEWPQQFLLRDDAASSFAEMNLPDCLPKAAWLQLDQYKNGSPNQKSTVNGLESAGVLNSQSEDSSVYKAHQFKNIPACVQATPTPTETPSGSDDNNVTPSTTPDSESPSVTPSETPSAPGTSANESATVDVVATPTDSAAAATPAGTTAAVVAAAATESSEGSLANTGFDSTTVGVAGAILLVIGFGALLLASRPRRKH